VAVTGCLLRSQPVKLAAHNLLIRCSEVTPLQRFVVEVTLVLLNVPVLAQGQAADNRTTVNTYAETARGEGRLDRGVDRGGQGQKKKCNASFALVAHEPLTFAQNTYEQRHSKPVKPTFFLHVQHLLRFFCSSLPPSTSSPAATSEGASDTVGAGEAEAVTVAATGASASLAVGAGDATGTLAGTGAEMGTLAAANNGKQRRQQHTGQARDEATGTPKSFTRREKKLKPKQEEEDKHDSGANDWGAPGERLCDHAAA
jgi:hypothetical protein